jgi:hypothetical protein
VSLTPILDWTDVTDDLRGDRQSPGERSNPNNRTKEPDHRFTDSPVRQLTDLVPSYRVQVSTDSTFGGTPAFDTSGLATSQVVVPAGRLNLNTLYFWRVNAADSGCTGAYSSVFRFTTLTGNPPAGLTLTVIPGGFYNTGLQQLNMKDTIKVLLVDSASCTKMDSAKVVLDSVTFSAAVTFNIAPTGLYYIYVYHRNHIPVSSRLRQNLIRGSTVSYNFTPDSSAAYGFNMIRVSTSPSRWGMIPGDANRDEYVDGLDQTIWIAENGLDGYQASDFNGDFFVDGLDQTIWILNNGASSFLPCFLTSYVVPREREPKMIQKRFRQDNPLYRNE